MIAVYDYNNETWYRLPDEKWICDLLNQQAEEVTKQINGPKTEIVRSLLQTSASIKDETLQTVHCNVAFIFHELI